MPVNEARTTSSFQWGLGRVRTKITGGKHSHWTKQQKRPELHRGFCHRTQRLFEDSTTIYVTKTYPGPGLVTISVSRSCRVYGNQIGPKMVIARQTSQDRPSPPQKSLCTMVDLLGKHLKRTSENGGFQRALRRLGPIASSCEGG